MSDWKIVTLESVAEIRASNVDKKIVAGEPKVKLCNYLDVYNNDYITNNIDFMVATASVAEIQRFGIEFGDVIITKDSETPDDIGIVTVVNEKIDNLVCGYHLSLLKPKKEIVNSIFLAKQMSIPETTAYFGRLANGSTRYGLSYKSIANTPIRIAPMLQQTRIAEILHTIDEAIEQTEALIAKTEKIKAGLTHDLFTRGVTPDGKLRPPREKAPELYKESQLGWIPKEWESKTMQQICYINQGLQIAIEMRYKSPGDGRHLYITIQYLNNPTSEFDTYYIEEKNSAVICNKQDVILVRTGNTGAVVTNVEGVFHNNFFKINYNRNLISRDYLVHFLNRVEIQQLITNYAGTTTIPDLKHGDFYKLPFQYPINVVEQTAIAQKLNSIEFFVKNEREYMRKLNFLKKGLMQDLLTGRVPVPVKETANA